MEKAVDGGSGIVAVAHLSAMFDWFGMSHFYQQIDALKLANQKHRTQKRHK
jgi:hypothetical protein